MILLSCGDLSKTHLERSDSTAFLFGIQPPSLPKSAGKLFPEELQGNGGDS
jgi:hypothetical protein